AWSAKKTVLYNPKERFIDYVIPGIIGLILQLLTVTLMACTIARERESGTLYQLMVTALRRREIVIGKMLPYLVVSTLLVVIIMLVSGWRSMTCRRWRWSAFCFSFARSGLGY